MTLSSVERLVYDKARLDFTRAAAQLAAAGSKSGKAASRAMAALTALRQSCCHPHIVRRAAEAAGNKRLSMRQIMAQLVTQVGWRSTCRLRACLCEPNQWYQVHVAWIDT